MVSTSQLWTSEVVHIIIPKKYAFTQRTHPMPKLTLYIYTNITLSLNVPIYAKKHKILRQYNCPPMYDGKNRKTVITFER